MKSLYRPVFALLLILLTSIAFAQTQPGDADDGMSIFLLALLAIFFSAIFAAAIVGACIAALILFAVFGLAFLGLLTGSVAVGIYKRSFSAGFQTFLLFLFVGGGLLLGSIIGLLLQKFFALPFSNHVTMATTIIGGGIGGFVLSIITHNVLSTISQKLIAMLKNK